MTYASELFRPKMIVQQLRGSSMVALTDQLVVSGGNFITNVLLARALTSDQYGIYALLLDAILFLNSLQAALLVYPLTVRSALMNDTEVRRFSGTCVLLTLLLALPLGGILILYGAINQAVSIAMWAVLAQTLWQCQETLRRTMLARGAYARALAGDIISYIGQAVVIWLLIYGGKGDVSRAFMTIAGTSLAAALLQGVQLGIRPAGLTGTLHIGRSFWWLGRWVMASNLSALLSSVCCSYALARSHGKSAVGTFAALGNLLRLANPLLITLSTLIVPAVAVASATGGLRAAKRAAWDFALVGGVLLVPYWVLLLMFPERAAAVMYPSRPEYRGLSAELRIFVGISVVTMVNIVLIALFNGLRRSRRTMAGHLVGAVATLAVTIPVTIHFGLRGLLFGTLASNVVIAAALLLLLHHLTVEDSLSEPAFV